MQPITRDAAEILDSERRLLAALGQRLTILRIERGLSQEAIAKQLGTRAYLVSKYERGQNNPKVAMLLRLRRYFGVSLDYLLAGAAANEIHDTRLLEIVQAADRLPPFLRDLLVPFFTTLLEWAQRWAEEHRLPSLTKER